MRPSPLQPAAPAISLLNLPLPFPISPLPRSKPLRFPFLRVVLCIVPQLICIASLSSPLQRRSSWKPCVRATPPLSPRGGAWCRLPAPPPAHAPTPTFPNIHRPCVVPVASLPAHTAPFPSEGSQSTRIPHALRRRSAAATHAPPSLPEVDAPSLPARCCPSPGAATLAASHLTPGFHSFILPHCSASAPRTRHRSHAAFTPAPHPPVPPPAPSRSPIAAPRALAPLPPPPLPPQLLPTASPRRPHCAHATHLKNRGEIRCPGQFGMGTRDA